jgi:hypothetical protein
MRPNLPVNTCVSVAEMSGVLTGRSERVSLERLCNPLTYTKLEANLTTTLPLATLKGSSKLAFLRQRKANNMLSTSETFYQDPLGTFLAKLWVPSCPSLSSALTLSTDRLWRPCWQDASLPRSEVTLNKK